MRGRRRTGGPSPTWWRSAAWSKPQGGRARSLVQSSPTGPTASPRCARRTCPAGRPGSAPVTVTVLLAAQGPLRAEAGGRRLHRRGGGLPRAGAAHRRGGAGRPARPARYYHHQLRGLHAVDPQGARALGQVAEVLRPARATRRCWWCTEPRGEAADPAGGRVRERRSTWRPGGWSRVPPGDAPLLSG